MKFIYLPYQRWDAMYDAMPEEIVCPVVIGGNLMACDFEGENQKVRIVRGLEMQIGLVEQRMLHDDFDTTRPSVLGTGIVANQMAKELIDEGKAIPQRLAPGSLYSRRVACSPVPTDCGPSREVLERQFRKEQHVSDVSRHDDDPKPRKRKPRKKAAKKTKRKRSR